VDITEAITNLARFRRKARKKPTWDQAIVDEPSFAHDLHYLLERIRVSTSSFELQLEPTSRAIQVDTRDAVEKLAVEIQDLINKTSSSNKAEALEAKHAIPSRLHLQTTVLP